MCVILTALWSGGDLVGVSISDWIVTDGKAAGAQEGRTGI